MKASNARLQDSVTHTNQGLMRVYSQTLNVSSTERTDLINLTDAIRSFAESTGVADGHIQISCLHTTAALFINEWQEALLVDIKSLIEGVVPREAYYRHNDPEYSDCDRHNADSHLRNVVMGQSLLIPISKGRLVLGRWQSIIFSEFDGPNQRRVFIQVFGI